MQIVENRFIDVFQKVKLSEVLVDKFKEAIVSSVLIDKENKNLNIDIILKNILDVRYIKALEEELLSAFPFVLKINLNLKYELEETDDFEKIKKIWEFVVFSVKEKSPLCHNIILDSNFILSEKELIINVKNNSAFVFTTKNIHKMIENIILKMLDLKVKVTFRNLVLSKEDKEKYNSFLIKRELDLVNEVEVLEKVFDSQYEKLKSSENNDGYKKYSGKAGGRASLKINPALLDELQDNLTKLSENIEADNEIIICGKIFEFELREIKSGNYLIIFDITDGTDSITVKFFIKPEKFDDEIKGIVKKGNNLIVKGVIQDDDFSKEITLMAKEIFFHNEEEKRKDNSEEKRVELHLHTQMSAMDGISNVKDIIKRALSWGHKAIAITDHGVVQAFPDAMSAASGKDIKIIYGVEAYLVDDLGAVVEAPKGQSLDSDFVIFDLETTGLKKETDSIIEIGAVRISDGKIVDTFSEFVNPKIKLPEKIIEITKITDDMLKDAKLIEEVLPKFIDFFGDSILVAHNASFDIGFLRASADRINKKVNNTVLDTLELSRTLLPELHRHKLNIIAEYLEIKLENHHRACDDAKATAEIFLKFSSMLRERNINTLDEINLLASASIDKTKLKTYHAIILVKNQIGLRNLYELVSDAHLKYFYRRPRIPKSEFLKFREGLIIGTACEAGEFYKAVIDKKSPEVIKDLAEFYDYFEIQPIDNNMFMLRNGIVSNLQELIDINKEIVSLGEKYNKPVVATCDVHFLEPEDEVYRKIIMFAEGFKDADLQAPLYFRTTEEMLEEFKYLGEEKAKEVVITNTNKIANMIEQIKPIPDETFPPHIDGCEEMIKNISMEKAISIYGSPLPKIVEERLERELHSIIKNGFSVMYIIAQKLVWKSLEDGYLVGSRGSVGSSFVATMLSITEVNPLQPHYFCEKCKYSDFDSDTVKSFAGGSGCDMPDMNCPVCGFKLSKEGHDIPFETFLGFDGDKEPDIDLNFSGEYQAKAHAYTEELFGEGFVFKAGTIGTVAEKTAYGFVRKYYDEKEINARSAEINRIRNGCTGIKRTTGQHPGGLMIVPSDHSIYEFCPIQRPANDTKSNVITTHFDYHSISGRLLKLDILGHDVPTIIRYLHDTTGVDPTKIDLGDKKIMSLFTSPEALGVSAEAIKCKTGSLGLPEFGTSFVRQMLLDTKPFSFAELVRISGLSHGTDVWFNNAQELIKDGVATLKEVIPTRDDIMVYLINKGVEKKSAFKIMENVRKGKGLNPDEEETMRLSEVPEWYIESCKRIKYMFPKGHAVAYVMMTVRIGYFKIYYPYSFYGASFSVKAEDFDYEIMCQGIERVNSEMNRINSLGKECTAKEKSSLTILELVYEMYARGLKFLQLDLYKSDASKFIVTPDGLLPPLCAIQGLGSNAAKGIVEAREEGEFLTIEEFKDRTKTSKTVISVMKDLGILKGIPDTDQISLF